MGLNNTGFTQMLKSSAPAEVKQEDPLEYYAKQTSQIEVSFLKK